MSALTELLAEHEFYTPRGYAWVTCECGAEFAEEYEARAHIAAVILDALTGEDVRDAVADAIHRSDCGCSDWHADDQEDLTYREHADAALAAIREALT